MSIAASVLDAIQAEGRQHPGQHVSRAGLRIGQLSGVEPESLRFCLEALVSGSDLEPLLFEIEICPWTRRCPACDQSFRVVDYRPECPTCGTSDTEQGDGDEMELSYIELEES